MLINVGYLGKINPRGHEYFKLNNGEFTAIYYYNKPYSNCTWISNDTFYRHSIKPAFLIKRMKSGLNMYKYFLATYEEIELSLKDE